MATAIREMILESIETALAALIPVNPTADDVRAVSRAQLPAKQQTIRPCVLLWTGTERKDQDSDTYTVCELDVHVHLLARAIHDIETEAADWINKLVKAICANPHRSGYAFDTIEVENEVYAADLSKPEYTVAMTFLVRYPHQHYTPDAQ